VAVGVWVEVAVGVCVGVAVIVGDGVGVMDAVPVAWGVGEPGGVTVMSDGGKRVGEGEGVSVGGSAVGVASPRLGARASRAMPDK
jgi:hypothetical protein